MANRWTRRNYTDPQAFGAVGDGVADDSAALQAWIDAQVNDQTGSGQNASKIVLHFGGRRYGIGSGLIFPASQYLTAYNPHLIALGSDWNIDEVMISNLCSNMDCYSAVIQCGHKANGLEDRGGRTRWYSPRVFNMGTGYRSYGFHRLNIPGNEAGIIDPHIRQWNLGESVNPEDYTADCVWIEHSDCYVTGGSLEWARTCYRGGNGVHELNHVHLCQGAVEYFRDDPELVEFGLDGTGTITFNNCYFDNGMCNFYNTTIVNFEGGRMHYSLGRSNFTDGAFRFAATGTAEPKLKGHLTFSENTANAQVLSFYDYDGHTWSTEIKDKVAQFNARIQDYPGNSLTVGFGNDSIRLVTNNNNPYDTIYGLPGTYLNLSHMDGGIQFARLSEEPVHIGVGFVMCSDGTASTNGFGTRGSGPYYKKANGYWVPMALGVSGGDLTLTTTPQAVHSAAIFGRALELTIVADNNTSYYHAFFTGGNTPAIHSVITTGIALVVTIVDTSIMVAVPSGTLAVNYSVNRTV